MRCRPRTEKMAEIRLRGYQERALDAVKAAYRGAAHQDVIYKDGHTGPARAVLLVMPCRSGKTYTFAAMAKRAAAKGNNVLILAHRKELIFQGSKSLAALGMRHRIIAPAEKIAAIRRQHVEDFHRPYVSGDANVASASIQTVTRRLSAIEDFDPALIITDEAHRSLSVSYTRIYDQAGHARRLGVTATPVRTDGRGLSEIYDAIVIGPSHADLQELGNICKCRVFAPPLMADLSSVKRKNGDLDADEQAKIMEEPTITGCAIEHYQRACKSEGRKLRGIVYCCNRHHAGLVADKFMAAGIRAATIDGTMDDRSRDRLINALPRGELELLVSVDLISEGVDLPVAEIAILLRKTESLGLYIQQTNRVLTPSPGKKYGIINDHVGNVLTHGMPDQHREWDLESGVKKTDPKKQDDDTPINILQCPACYGVDYPRKICGLPLPGGETCRHEFEARQRKPIKQAEGELREITENEAESLRQQQRIAQAQARTLEQLQAAGMGRKQAEHVLAAREEKTRLRNDLTALLRRYRERYGDPGVDLGIRQSDVGRLKPKALREAIELVSDAIFQAPLRRGAG